MPKTKFERELEQKRQGHLIAMCDQRDLDHTGDRESLISKLVAWEKAQSKESEPEPKPPETAGESIERVAEEEAPEVKVEVTPPPGPED